MSAWQNTDAKLDGYQGPFFPSEVGPLQFETTTQLFLGVRMVCAQCHDHPFEKWTQNQYFSLAAFFAGIAGVALVGVSVAIAVVVGILSGLYPAWRSSRLSPSLALQG